MKLFRKSFFKIYILPIVAGVVSSISWQSTYFFLLELVALVPLIIAIYTLRNKKFSFFKKLVHLFFIALLFRVPQFFIGINWLVKMSLDGFVLLCLFEVISLTIILSPILIKKIRFIAIVLLFIVHEYLIQQLMILPPFYIFGYSWANHIELVQFYSIIGIEGASVLLYLANYSFFRIYLSRTIKKSDYIVFTVFLSFIVFSLFKFYSGKNALPKTNTKVTIVNSNVSMKDKNSPHYAKMILQNINRVSHKNSLVVLPEELFYRLGWLNTLYRNSKILALDSLRKANHQDFLLGAFVYHRTFNPTPQSTYSKRYQIYYNFNNVSILLNDHIQLKSKHIFLPFFEYVPNNFIFQWINKYFTNIGSPYQVSELKGRNGHFSYKGRKFDVLLCYEAMFPLYVAKKARNKNFLVAQSEEHWLHDKQASYQSLITNRALAIATGIPLIKTSNHGYSAYIMPNGKMTSMFNTDDKFSALYVSLPRHTSTSFYVKIYGYSYKVSFLLLGLILLLDVFGIKRSKFGLFKNKR